MSFVDLSGTQTLSDEMKKNLFSIFEIGKDKFNLTDEEMEMMKVLVIKKFMHDMDEKEKNDTSNP